MASAASECRYVAPRPTLSQAPPEAGSEGRWLLLRQLRGTWEHWAEVRVLQGDDPMIPEVIIAIVVLIGVFAFMRPGERTLTDSEAKEFSRLYGMNKSFGDASQEPKRVASPQSALGFGDITVSDVHAPQWNLSTCAGNSGRATGHVAAMRCHNCGAPGRTGSACGYCREVVR